MVARFPDTEEVTGSNPVSPTVESLSAQGFFHVRQVADREAAVPDRRPRTVHHERLAQWNGSPPEPRLIFGPGAEILESALRAETDIASCTALLDDFFMSHLRIDDAQRAFERALAVPQASPQFAALAGAASVSPRQVQRLLARCLGMYVPPLLEALGMVELEHNAPNKRVRALGTDT